MVFGKLRKRKKLYSERDIVRFSEKIDKSSGVYFLIKRGKVTYIGRSKNISRRIGRHLTDTTKDFDAIAYMPVEDQGQIGDLEVEYIKTIKPQNNKRNNPKHWRYHRSTWIRHSDKRWYPKAYKKPKKQAKSEKRKDNKKFQ